MTVWGMLPQEILNEIKCIEIASEAILGQKQSHIVAIHSLQSISSNFWPSMYVFAKPIDIELLQENSRTEGACDEMYIL